MTRHDIIEKIYLAHAGRLTRNEVKKILFTIFGEISKELANSGQAKISHFGTFKVAKTPTKAARNPRTGEPVIIPDRYVPKFKASRTLQNVVNGVTA